MILDQLKAILENNRDKAFGTFDYDGIAVEVMRLVGDITEAEYSASGGKPKQSKQITCVRTMPERLGGGELRWHLKPKQPKLRYRQMLRDINILIDNDFGLDIEGKWFNDKKFTQKEAKQMAEILIDIYGISHGIYCDLCASCRGYKLKRKK